MFSYLNQFRGAWQGFKAFKAISPVKRELVVYNEGHGYWPHLERIVRHLWTDHNQAIAYLTSQKDDPVLHNPPPGVQAFWIGEGLIRTIAFATMQARVVIMTMPDLEVLHIKRSSQVGHYVYIHHSIVSCHMVYQPAAFDHFDSVFCVGPHHEREIRAREKQLGLPAKRLLAHGYGRLDTLLEEVAVAPETLRTADQPARILIAPSWGPAALLERHGSKCVAPLLAAGYRVTLRPHPQTRRFNAQKLDAIAAEFSAHPRFVLEENIATKRSLLEADLMISDWSGASLEFCFSRLKPVLSVDVPRKVNNPDYETLGLEPLEVSVRDEIGAVVPETQLSHLAAHAASVLARLDDTQLAALRRRCVHNLGQSGAVAAAEIVRLLRA